jgi:hypothetical protein
MIFVMTNRFREEPQYSNSASIELPVPTSCTPALVQFGFISPDRIYGPSPRYLSIYARISKAKRDSGADAKFLPVE